MQVRGNAGLHSETVTIAHPRTPIDLATIAPSQWWRSAVIYQIYPRSFADSNGDGIGDLPGITARLDALSELGVDAIWLSPFFTSPQRDAGYDVSNYRDVDPRFGTLADADRLIAAAHERGIRVIADIVPNHSSSDHPWFQEALAAGPGSPERDRYMFRDGRGRAGELPPNNWESVFGGSMWTRVTEPDGTLGQWYLHIFDTSQPDFNWHNSEVREEFLSIFRFWLDRGIDGFRVDVAHGLIKADGLPDYIASDNVGSMGGIEGGADDSDAPIRQAPYWGQDGVHEIYRQWRTLFDSYPGERILCAEAWVEPVELVAKWVRPDEMHQAFNFGYLSTAWDANALRTVINHSLAVFGSVGAPSTWVLSNHDVVRHATRLMLSGNYPQGVGVGPRDVADLGPRIPSLQRARAATALMLGLPGSAYVYQGEELGLPEAIDLPDSARQDPTWFRTNGERYGRDGCRVPLPWHADGSSMGFAPDASHSHPWLPQPEIYREYARASQQGVPGSTLELYRELLRVRAEHRLAEGSLEWVDGFAPEVVALRNNGVVVIANLGAEPVPLPAGEVLVHSGVLERTITAEAGQIELAPDTTVWLRPTS